MTNETLPLAKCPYCDHDALIAMSTTAVPDYFRRYRKSWDLYKEPTQSLLDFNSPTSDQQPCPHCLGIHGLCVLSELKSDPLIEGDRFEFCWWHPQMKSPATKLVFDRLLNPFVPDHLKRDVPFREIDITHCWSAAGDGYRGKHWLIEGYAFFCPDVQRFVGSASALMEAK